MKPSPNRKITAVLCLAISTLSFTTLYAAAPQFRWAVNAGGGHTYGYATDEIGMNIAVQGTGDVYVTGNVADNAAFGSTTLTTGGTFLAKYDAAGNLAWARSAGGYGGSGVALDPTGHPLVTGAFLGTANFGTTTLTNAGESDVFIAKYDSAGNAIWARRGGGSSSDTSHGTAADPAGNAYIVGEFYSTNATFENVTLTNAGINDVFLTKYDSLGNLVWARRAGGTGSDTAYAVAVDAAGNIYITGAFSSVADFGGVTLTNYGMSDLFVAKYDPAGNVLWARNAGGAGYAYGYGIATSGPYVYVTGSFQWLAQFGSINLTSVGSQDIFLAKYDTNGNVIWARNAGGYPGYNSGKSVAIGRQTTAPT